MLKYSIFFLLILVGTYPNAQSDWKLPEVREPRFGNAVYPITDFGAVPDGFFLNTKSIQDAIDACSGKGGGTVQVPAGLWLTGPLVLKSAVNLNLAAGATLLFTKDKSRYPLVKANWEGFPQMRNQAPISAENATDIAITGKGIIDGNGDAWRAVKKDKLTESQWMKRVASGGVLSTDGRLWMPSESYAKGEALKDPGRISPDKDAAFYASVKDFFRPNLLVLTSCDGVLLEGVTFQNSPAWCLHPLMSRNITVRDLSVKNPWYAQNGDGIDLESCSNVLIENSVFDVGDDALCMKSGRDADGRQRGMPTKDVIIRNCTVYASHGGFVVGSEMSGGVNNVYVSNCSFIGSDIGLRFKTTRGRGGVVEHIFIKDIYMKDIPGDAILFDMYYMAKDPVPLEGEKRTLPKVERLPVNETTPQFRNIEISNVYVNGAEKAVFLRGLPEMPVRGIRIRNAVFQSKKGIDIQEAADIRFQNVKVYTAVTQPVIDVINGKQIQFDRLDYGRKAELLLRISGSNNDGLQFRNTSYKEAEKKLEASLGATEAVVSFK
ncbi:glycoside hydrolase family 28 protein [Niabella beijingensis]|uniref:glycoside hydrolase family 28 protein n=1 Tax=Niabella beijingensis TaxID=2872700 RepID=UPI001CC02642|nr:glycoside hydrolase family 28 protein [Niabella beijingensis]MBZ4190225.1 glycoside hydrolase family 28 protein [Niabella beijingensis]